MLPFLFNVYGFGYLFVPYTSLVKHELKALGIPLF